jgi:hypothetical protein
MPGLELETIYMKPVAGGEFIIVKDQANPELVFFNMGFALSAFASVRPCILYCNILF